MSCRYSRPTTVPSAQKSATACSGVRLTADSPRPDRRNPPKQPPIDHVDSEDSRQKPPSDSNFSKILGPIARFGSPEPTAWTDFGCQNAQRRKRRLLKPMVCDKKATVINKRWILDFFPWRDIFFLFFLSTASLRQISPVNIFIIMIFSLNDHSNRQFIQENTFPIKRRIIIHIYIYIYHQKSGR